MFSHLPVRSGFLLDAGVPLGAFIFGMVSVVLTFIVVVVEEAGVMKRCFPSLSLKTCGHYSILINTVSLVLNLPLAYLACADDIASHTVSGRVLEFLLFITYAVLLPTFKFGYIGWLVLTFVLAILSELLLLLRLLKPQPVTSIIRYVLLSNAISMVIILLSFLPWMVVSFLWA